MRKKYSLSATVLLGVFMLSGCATSTPEPTVTPETNVAVCSEMSEYSKTEYTTMDAPYSVQLKKWADTAEPELRDALLILAKAVKDDPGVGSYSETSAVKSICGAAGINDLNGYF